MASDLINSFLGRGMLINPEVLKDSALLEKLAKIDEEQFKGVFVIDKAFIKKRQDFQRVTSIARIKYKKERESVMFCGLVYAKSTTKKNNILLTVEDPSGKVKVVVSEKKKELFELAKEMVLDELIGVEGTAGGNFVMAKPLFPPA